MLKQGEEAKQALRNEKKKNRLRLQKTAEYQKRKQEYETNKKILESKLRKVARFDENDEMVLS